MAVTVLDKYKSSQSMTTGYLSHIAKLAINVLCNIGAVFVSQTLNRLVVE